MGKRSCMAMMTGAILVCPGCLIPMKQISGPTGVPEEAHEIICQECQRCGMEFEIQYYPELKVVRRIGYEA